MGHFQTLTPPVKAHTLLIIDDTKGTITSAQVYDGNLGRNYSTETLVKPLPETGSEKWKKWKKDGYVEVPVETFDVLKRVDAKAAAPAPEAPKVAPPARTPIKS